MQTDDGNKLEISFSLGRNKTIYVIGEYDQKATSPNERLQFLEIVSRFGQQLAEELIQNYNSDLFKLVMCEVDPGHIMFELETNAPAAVRRKVIEAVQQNFVEEPIQADPVFNVNGPSLPQ